MSVQIADAKAPFVQFESRAEEDRAKTIEMGRFVAKDVTYALITPHGSKDVIERVATEWLDHMDVEARQGRLPMEWAQAYRKAFKAWEEGNEVPPEGTAIINWPLASPAQVRTLKSLHILTVEKLAAANEQMIASLGMGGRDLVNKAKEFIKQAEGPGRAAAKITALEAELQDSKAAHGAASEQLKTLSARLEVLEKQTPAPTGRQAAGISSDDLLKI